MTQRKAAYWATTAFAALALGATGLADLLRVPAIWKASRISATRRTSPPFSARGNCSALPRSSVPAGRA